MWWHWVMNKLIKTYFSLESDSEAVICAYKKRSRSQGVLIAYTCINHAVYRNERVIWLKYKLCINNKQQQHTLRMRFEVWCLTSKHKPEGPTVWLWSITTMVLSVRVYSVDWKYLKLKPQLMHWACQTLHPSNKLFFHLLVGLLI